MNPGGNRIPGFGFDPGFEPKPAYVQPPPPSGSIFGLISKVNQGVIQEPPKSVVTEQERPADSAGLQQAKAIAQKLSSISPQVAREQAKQKAFLDAKSTIEKIQGGTWRPSVPPPQQFTQPPPIHQQLNNPRMPAPVAQQFKVPLLPNQNIQQTPQQQSLARPVVPMYRPSPGPVTTPNIILTKSLVAYDDEEEKERKERRDEFDRDKALEEIDRYRSSRMNAGHSPSARNDKRDGVLQQRDPYSSISLANRHAVEDRNNAGTIVEPGRRRSGETQSQRNQDQIYRERRRFEEDSKGRERRDIGGNERNLGRTEGEVGQSPEIFDYGHLSQGKDHDRNRGDGYQRDNRQMLEYSEDGRYSGRQRYGEEGRYDNRDRGNLGRLDDRERIKDDRPDGGDRRRSEQFDIREKQDSSRYKNTDQRSIEQYNNREGRNIDRLDRGHRNDSLTYGELHRKTGMEQDKYESRDVEDRFYSRENRGRYGGQEKIENLKRLERDAYPRERYDDHERRTRDMNEDRGNRSDKIEGDRIEYRRSDRNVDRERDERDRNEHFHDKFKEYELDRNRDRDFARDDRRDFDRNRDREFERECDIDLDRYYDRRHDQDSERIHSREFDIGSTRDYDRTGVRTHSRSPSSDYRSSSIDRRLAESSHRTEDYGSRTSSRDEVFDYSEDGDVRKDWKRNEKRESSERKGTKSAESMSYEEYLYGTEMGQRANGKKNVETTNEANDGYPDERRGIVEIQDTPQHIINESRKFTESAGESISLCCYFIILDYMYIPV